jgi:hypothetical protein
MDKRIFFTMIEVISNNLLAIAIYKEVDGSSWDSASQSGPKSFE